MANEELGKLSPEQIQKLAVTISEAKDLTGQQEEIIKRVLAGETEIGNIRISSLERYFDIYSKNLDLIARKYSELDDTFLILGKKLNEGYKALSSDITHLERELSNATRAASNIRSIETPKVNRRTQEQEKTQPIQTNRNIESLQSLRRYNQQYDYSNTNNITDYARQAPIREGFATSQIGDNNGSSSAGAAEIGNNVNVASTVTEEARNALSLENSQNIELSDILGQLDIQEVQILEQRKERNQEYLKQLLDAAKKAQTDMINLAIARNRTEEELEAQRLEARIDRLKAATDAELKAQTLYNKLADEQAKAKTKKGRSEIAKTTVRQVNAEEELKSLQELERQRADLRAELTLEAMLRTNGKLTEKDAAEIEKQINQKYKLEKKALKELTQKRLEGEIESKKLSRFAKEDPQMAAALEKKKADYAAKLEYEARKKNHGKLSKEEKEAIKKQASEKYKLDEENLKKLEKQELRRQEKEQKARAQAGDAAIQAAVSGPLTKENNLVSRFKELKAIADDVDDEDKSKAQMAVAIKAISSLAAQLESKIDNIASYKGDIDTRLQGSNNKKVLGSYWDQLSRDMMSVGAVTPFFKQEDFANNIKTLVDQGISFDLKQRAFLMTIQEKIATTFDVADGTLLRLIRLQQEDSTAGRLGMESALNSFLNNMYENTEYLKTVADGVRSSLEEMEALMTGAEATEVEYQVQKWMGSLYSVGMSQSAVNTISNALGQIAAGQVEALTGGGAGNLLVMAANDAGIPIADILAKGLDAKETNKLLQATVNYLAEIAESSKGNNVVQQQLANVFGVKASDLKAAVNLAAKDTTSNIAKSSLTYDNMLRQLNDMAGSMALRTSIGEMMTNVWDNGQYTLASSMANNPVSYLLYKMSSLLEDTTGGIPLPFVSVGGFGVDLETTVADLMRVASLGSGILGSLGSMVSGLASSFSGRAMLTKMGIESGSGLAVTPRGEGIGAGDNSGGGAKTTSGSGYVGNASGSDIKNSTLQEAEDTKKKEMIEAKEETEETQVDFINMNVLRIYQLLDEVASGKRSFNVKMTNFGLIGSSLNTGGSQGGVSGLLSNSPASGAVAPNGGFSTSSLEGSSSSSSGSKINESSGSDFGLGSKVDLDGWTMI